jgi:hypothetical protein
MCDVLLPPGVNPTAVKYIYHISYNTNRQSPESSEHQILWFCVIPNLVITGILIATFNQDFNP